MCLVRSPTHSKKYDIKSLSIPSTENCLLPSQGLSSWVKMNRKQLFYIVQITTMEAKSRKSQTGPAMYCDRKSSKFSHLQQQNRFDSFTALKLQNRPRIYFLNSCFGYFRKHFTRASSLEVTSWTCVCHFPKSL